MPFVGLVAAVLSAVRPSVPSLAPTSRAVYNSNGNRIKLLHDNKLFDFLKLLICFAVPTAKIACTVPTGVLASGNAAYAIVIQPSIEITGSYLKREKNQSWTLDVSWINSTLRRC